MEWTFTKPTKEGAYLYRIGQNRLRAAMIFWHGAKYKGELRAVLTGTYMDYPLSALSGEWAGPIPVPEEKR
jgi:hypothetical protein